MLLLAENSEALVTDGLVKYAKIVPTHCKPFYSLEYTLKTRTHFIWSKFVGLIGFWP